MEATSEGRDGGADMLFAFTTSLALYSLHQTALFSSESLTDQLGIGKLSYSRENERGDALKGG